MTNEKIDLGESSRVFEWRSFGWLILAYMLFTTYDLLGNAAVPISTLLITNSLGLIGLFLIIIIVSLFWAMLINFFYDRSFKYSISYAIEKVLYISSVVVVSGTLYLFADRDDLIHIMDQDIVYEIESSDLLNSDLRILEARLSDYLPSRYSRLQINEKQNTITFLRGAPSEEIINYLSQNKGEFVIYGSSALEPWITNRQVLSASMYGDVSSSTIKFLLTSEGGEIMLTHTKKGSSGNNVNLILDGISLAQPSITGPLGSSFNINFKEEIDFASILTLINTGPLTNEIKLQRKN